MTRRVKLWSYIYSHINMARDVPPQAAPLGEGFATASTPVRALSSVCHSVNLQVARVIGGVWAEAAAVPFGWFAAPTQEVTVVSGFRFKEAGEVVQISSPEQQG